MVGLRLDLWPLDREGGVVGSTVAFPWAMGVLGCPRVMGVVGGVRSVVAKSAV